MADTVKKSRIVSDTSSADDNLEEALMEEFNIRLKSCLSQDDLLISDEPEQEQYENVAIITSKQPNGIASQDFIDAEQANYYESPIERNSNGHTVMTPRPQKNGHDTPNTDEQIIYENFPPPGDTTATSNNQYVDMTSPASPDIAEETSYEIVGMTPSDFISARPDLTLTDLSETTTETADLKSVKDRMLLSTDAQPCLLFTQTVTSPMLTPSEENIDFLKGFREESDDANDNQQQNGGGAEEVLYENLKNHNNQEHVYENLKDNTQEGAGDVIYQNLVELKMSSDVTDCQATSQDINHVINDDNACQTQQETVVIEDVINNDDVIITTDLKSVDILKQIEKFEISEDSTQQVTESYVETTTIETSCEMGDNKSGLKKKKTKKSRKEEKENISVAQTGTNRDDTYYNVNVKNLCRSFGDLTKMGENKNGLIVKERTRAKSLSEAKFPINHEIENVFCGVSVRTLREKLYANILDNWGCSSNTKTSRKLEGLKSSFNKFDALQKKNVLHVRSSDSSKAQEKFNGAQIDTSNCKSCDKQVFQMEQIKAERAVWHKNCFRCKECNKQLTVDTYQSHEGTLYCKPHFKALFAPKVVEDEAPPSDKPDLGLEELQSLNVRERFQVFEQHQQQTEIDRTNSAAVNVKRSPSILSKLAKFQAKGMDVGVSDEALNGIPIEESSSEEEDEEDGGGELGEGEDADLVRAKKVQKEKPFHFTGMVDVKNKWENQLEENANRDERREERKQEIQTIRSRLFMGKQGKMKEAYQNAIMVSESSTNLKYKEPIEICDTKSIKEKFEKGEVLRDPAENDREREDEDTEVYESEISKNSRSLFMELDANASKAPQMQPAVPTPKLDVRKAREAYMAKTSSSTSSSDVIKSSIDQVDEVQVKTADIQERFKFFETYKEPEKEKKSFRITPPREGQVKTVTPEREIYRDPDVVRSEEAYVEDSVIAKETHTATKMLNKFRQMEESLTKEPAMVGGPLKPLKCFTPPPEPTKRESSSEGDDSGSEEDSAEQDEFDRKIPDGDLLEAQKAARAKQLRAKFEKWEANEIKREQQGTVNITEEYGEDQSSIESTKTLRARFESMRDSSNSADTNRQPRVKVNRFVDFPSVTETCDSCNSRVYPLEKITVHNRILHKNCFKCMECSCVLRMDSYSYNQGLLYCLPHFKRLFISKGNYDTGFGLGQHKEKWNNATLA